MPRKREYKGGPSKRGRRSTKEGPSKRRKKGLQRDTQHIKNREARLKQQETEARLKQQKTEAMIKQQQTETKYIEIRIAEKRDELRKINEERKKEVLERIRLIKEQKTETIQELGIFEDVLQTIEKKIEQVTSPLKSSCRTSKLSFMFMMINSFDVMLIHSKSMKELEWIEGEMSNNDDENLIVNSVPFRDFQQNLKQIKFDDCINELHRRLLAELLKCVEKGDQIVEGKISQSDDQMILNKELNNWFRFLNQFCNADGFIFQETVVSKWGIYFLIQSFLQRDLTEWNQFWHDMLNWKTTWCCSFQEHSIYGPSLFDLSEPTEMKLDDKKQIFVLKEIMCMGLKSYSNIRLEKSDMEEYEKQGVLEMLLKQPLFETPIGERYIGIKLLNCGEKIGEESRLFRQLIDTLSFRIEYWSKRLKFDKQNANMVTVLQLVVEKIDERKKTLSKGRRFFWER
jgi:hypothetical protein